MAVRRLLYITLDFGLLAVGQADWTRTISSQVMPNHHLEVKKIFLPRNTQDARSTGRFSGDEEEEEQDPKFFQELDQRKLLAGNSND